MTRRPSQNNPAEVAERNGVSVLDATTGGAEQTVCCGCALTTRNMRLESIPIAILALLPLGVDAAEARFLMLGGISWRELILVALDLVMVGVFIVPWACKCRRCCTFEAMELNISLFRMFNMGYEEERGASGGSRRVEVSQCWCRVDSVGADRITHVPQAAERHPVLTSTYPTGILCETTKPFSARREADGEGGTTVAFGGAAGN